MNDAPLDLSSGKAETGTRQVGQSDARPFSAESSAQTETRSGRLVLSGITLPKGTVSFAVYLNSKNFRSNTEKNLVGYATLLSPLGKPDVRSGKIDAVLPLPRKVRSLIEAEGEVSFSIEMGGQPSTATMARALTGRAQGFSVREVRLELR